MVTSKRITGPPDRFVAPRWVLLDLGEEAGADLIWALEHDLVCIKQAGYRRDRAARYAIDPAKLADMDRGLGPLERPAFDAMNFAAFRLIQLLRKITLTNPITIKRGRELAKWATLRRRLLQAIVSANIGLVKAAVCRIPHDAGIDEDMVACGMEVLCRCATLFDNSVGVKFGTYASSAVHHALVRERQLNAKQDLSLPIDAIDDTDLASPHHAALIDLRAALNGTRVGLSDLERDVLNRRFGLNGHRGGMTFRAAGKLMDLRKDQVCRIQEAALAKLRVALTPPDCRLFNATL